jgi:hypothetical protein
MRQIDIRSRLGNLVLGFVGAAYLLAALSVLVYYFATSGPGSELLLALLLVPCIAGASWFVLIASGNLRGRRLRH